MGSVGQPQRRSANGEEEEKDGRDGLDATAMFPSSSIASIDRNIIENGPGGQEGTKRMGLDPNARTNTNLGGMGGKRSPSTLSAPSLVIVPNSKDWNSFESKANALTERTFSMMASIDLFVGPEDEKNDGKKKDDDHLDRTDSEYSSDEDDDDDAFSISGRVSQASTAFSRIFDKREDKLNPDTGVYVSKIVLSGYESSDLPFDVTVKFRLWVVPHRDSMSKEEEEEGENEKMIGTDKSRPSFHRRNKKDDRISSDDDDDDNDEEKNAKKKTNHSNANTSPSFIDFVCHFPSKTPSFVSSSSTFFPSTFSMRDLTEVEESIVYVHPIEPMLKSYLCINVKNLYPPQIPKTACNAHTRFALDHHRVPSKPRDDEKSARTFESETIHVEKKDETGSLLGDEKMREASPTFPLSNTSRQNSTSDGANATNEKVAGKNTTNNLVDNRYELHVAGGMMYDLIVDQYDKLYDVEKKRLIDFSDALVRLIRTEKDNKVHDDKCSDLPLSNGNERFGTNFTRRITALKAAIEKQRWRVEKKAFVLTFPSCNIIEKPIYIEKKPGNGTTTMSTEFVYVSRIWCLNIRKHIIKTLRTISRLDTTAVFEATDISIGREGSKKIERFKKRDDDGDDEEYKKESEKSNSREKMDNRNGVTNVFENIYTIPFELTFHYYKIPLMKNDHEGEKIGAYDRNGDGINSIDDYLRKNVSNVNSV